MPFPPPQTAPPPSQPIAPPPAAPRLCLSRQSVTKTCMEDAWLSKHQELWCKPCEKAHALQALVRG